MRWIGLVRQVDRYLRKTGNDEHTCLMFQDGIHSPNLMTFRPFSAPPRPTLPAPYMKHGGYGPLSRKLLQHPQIVLEQEADVVDFVTQKHRAVNTHSEGIA